MHIFQRLLRLRVRHACKGAGGRPQKPTRRHVHAPSDPRARNAQKKLADDGILPF